MNRAEVAKALAVLKAAWPDRTVNAETVTAYELAWSDLPAELGQRAVAEHLRSGKFFPAASEIRKIALQRGAGIASADEAWDEAMRIIREHRHGSVPVWPTRAIEQAVNSVGWYRLKTDENPGTLRAQFRDAYEHYAEVLVTQEDARCVLEDAARRKAMAEPPARPALPEAEMIALPPAPPVPECYETYEGRRKRLQFERRQAAKGIVPNAAPNTLPAIRETPGWKGLGAEYRRWLEARPRPTPALGEGERADG